MEQGQTVGFRHAENIIGGDEPSSAHRVLDHDRWISRNVFRQMTREQARPDINRAAGRKPGDDADGLTRVKRLLGGEPDLSP